MMLRELQALELMSEQHVVSPFSHISSVLVTKATCEAFNCYLAPPGIIIFLLSSMMEANDFNNQLRNDSSSINGT